MQGPTDLVRAWVKAVEASHGRDVHTEWDLPQAHTLVGCLVSHLDPAPAARDFAQRCVVLGASCADVDADLMVLASLWPDDDGVEMLVGPLRATAARAARRASTWTSGTLTARELPTGLHNPHLLVAHLRRRLEQREGVDVLFLRWTPAVGVRLDTSRLAVAIAVRAVMGADDLVAVVGADEVALSTPVRERHHLLAAVLGDLTELATVDRRVEWATETTPEGLTRWLVGQSPGLLTRE